MVFDAVVFIDQQFIFCYNILIIYQFFPEPVMFVMFFTGSFTARLLFFNSVFVNRGINTLLLLHLLAEYFLLRLSLLSTDLFTGTLSFFFTYFFLMEPVLYYHAPQDFAVLFFSLAVQ